jgi:molecular chaperone DnaJ
VDLYIVLGLAHDASDTDVKRAYRRLARRYHPDINPGDRDAEARFRQVLEAYETLIDRERRTRYDQGHRHGPEPRPRTSEFEGFDFSTRGVDYSASFGDLVAEVLLDREHRPEHDLRGTDRHQEVRISLREAIGGAAVAVTLSRKDGCRACAGKGTTPGTATACAMCQGSGAVRSVRGHMVFSRACSACGARASNGHDRATPARGPAKRCSASA